MTCPADKEPLGLMQCVGSKPALLQFVNKMDATHKQKVMQALSPAMNLSVAMNLDGQDEKEVIQEENEIAVQSAQTQDMEAETAEESDDEESVHANLVLSSAASAVSDDKDDNYNEGALRS